MLSCLCVRPVSQAAHTFVFSSLEAQLKESAEQIKGLEEAKAALEAQLCEARDQLQSVEEERRKLEEVCIRPHPPPRMGCPPPTRSPMH